MAVKNYKVDEAIKVEYQAAGAASALTVQMDVYDEADVLDAGQSGVMVEKGSTGRYVLSFTPDAEGEWSAHISDSNGGNAVRQFSVGTDNISSVASRLTTVEGKVDTLDTKVDAINTKVDALESPPMVA